MPEDFGDTSTPQRKGVLMLVLTRKENESIRIGDDIFVTVARIQGNRIRFTIDAPKEVRILRGELQVTAPAAEVAKTLEGMRIDPLKDQNAAEPEKAA